MSSIPLPPRKTKPFFCSCGFVQVRGPSLHPPLPSGAETLPSYKVLTFRRRSIEEPAGPRHPPFKPTASHLCARGGDTQRAMHSSESVPAYHSAYTASNLHSIDSPRHHDKAPDKTRDNKNKTLNSLPLATPRVRPLMRHPIIAGRTSLSSLPARGYPTPPPFPALRGCTPALSRSPSRG